MTSINKCKKIFLLAGESSGDYIGSCIMRGLKKKYQNINFFGVGGPLMQKEGLNSLYDINEFNIIGFLNTILNFKKLNYYVNQIIKIIIKEEPDIVITVDTKGFSLALAKNLKKAFKICAFKSPLIHFVPPTIWAYGKSRIKKWKNLHNELICMYKIEENIFKEYDTKCTYLGNPIIEKYLAYKQKSHDNKLNNFTSSNSKNINCLLLPGSRNSEIKYIFPEFIKLIQNSHHQFKNINWIIPTTKTQYAKILSKIDDLNDYSIKVIILEDNYEILKNANIAIACSGTITLELVLFKIPTIAVYKTDFLSSLIGRLMVNFKNVILPNFLLGEFVVPFLFQEKCNHVQLKKLLYNYIKNLEHQNNLYKKHSKKILQNMNYMNANSINFSNNAAKMISNLIEGFNR